MEKWLLVIPHQYLSHFLKRHRICINSDPRYPLGRLAMVVDYLLSAVESLVPACQVNGLGLEVRCQGISKEKSDTCTSQALVDRVLTLVCGQSLMDYKDI